MATIVVGIEDSPRGQDAVALACDLAGASGAEVLAVRAYPFDSRESAHYNPARTASGALPGTRRTTDPHRGLTRIATHHG